MDQKGILGCLFYIYGLRGDYEYDKFKLSFRLLVEYSEWKMERIETSLLSIHRTLTNDIQLTLLCSPNSAPYVVKNEPTLEQFAHYHKVLQVKRESKAAIATRLRDSSSSSSSSETFEEDEIIAPVPSEEEFAKRELWRVDLDRYRANGLSVATRIHLGFILNQKVIPVLAI